MVGVSYWRRRARSASESWGMGMKIRLYPEGDFGCRFPARVVGGPPLYTIIGVMPPSFRFPIDQPLKSVWTTGCGRRSRQWKNAGRPQPQFALAGRDSQAEARKGRV